MSCGSSPGQSLLLVFQETLHLASPGLCQVPHQDSFPVSSFWLCGLAQARRTVQAFLVARPFGDPNSLCLTQLGQGWGAGVALVAAIVPSPGFCSGGLS